MLTFKNVNDKYPVALKVFQCALRASFRLERYAKTSVGLLEEKSSCELKTDLARGMKLIACLT